MFTLLPFLLIAIALGVIIFLIVKNYSKLILLDVETIPEVKAGRKKDEILKKRVEDRTKQVSERWSKILTPVVQKLKEVQLKFRKYVGRVQKKIIEEGQVRVSGIADKSRKKQRITVLLQEATTAFKNGNFNEAEKNYISAVKLDPKSKESYQGLAEVYYEQGQIEESKETYNFLLQLDPDNEQALVKMAEIMEEDGKIEKAIGYYQQAVLLNHHNPMRFVRLYDLLFKVGQYETALEAIQQALDIEPQNPKYLDNLTEVSNNGQ